LPFALTVGLSVYHTNLEEERRMSRRNPLSAICVTVATALAAAYSAAADNIAYIVHGGYNNGDPYGGEFGILDLDTGDFMSLGMPVAEAGLTGLAFANGMFFASTSNHTLATINCEGSLYDEVAFFGEGFDPDKSGDRVTDLATDPKGRLWGHARIAGTDSLIRIDPQTAEITLIGPIPTHSGGYSCIAARDNRLYVQETNDPGSFDEIDPATGASINNIPGGVPDGALGMAYNPDDGMLWASSYGGDELGDSIYCIDPDTGDEMLKFDYDDERRIHDIEFVPEYAHIDKRKVKRGEQTGGNIHSLGKSDDRRLKVDSEHVGNKYQTQTIVRLTSPCPSISELSVTVETGCSKNGVKTKIEIYDYNQGKWNKLESFSQSRSDSTKMYGPLNNPNKYVRDSDSQMQLRITSYHRSKSHTLKIDYIRMHTEH